MSSGFNLNNFVWVKVTDFGWEVHSDHWAPYTKYTDHGHTRPANVNGWSKFQLWDLMSTFGSAHMLGSRPCFEGGDIYFKKPRDA